MGFMEWHNLEFQYNIQHCFHGGIYVWCPVIFQNITDKLKEEGYSKEKIEKFMFLTQAYLLDAVQENSHLLVFCIIEFVLVLLKE